MLLNQLTTITSLFFHIQDAIAAAKPWAIIVEEAAELPEATLAAVLSLSSLERCVMVGDHQQLRPPVQAYDLVHKNLNISMFERLIKLGLRAPRLKYQSRMHPDVLDPVLQHYPDLQSSEKRVQNCTMPLWMCTPLFWWECEHPGSLLEGTTSYHNARQAEMAVNLSNFLVYQRAVRPAEITILVPYSGQLYYVRMLLDSKTLQGAPTMEKRDKKEDFVQVSTVDNYQGDENDIIILLLVRCDHNNKNAVGFLRETNRKIVATSRQKRALYIIGSSECFGTVDEWKVLTNWLRQPYDPPRNRPTPTTPTVEFEPEELEVKSFAPPNAESAVTMPEINKLSVKDLKALITRAGLSFSDCIEKQEFVKRAAKAQRILDNISQENSEQKNSVPTTYNNPVPRMGESFPLQCPRHNKALAVSAESGIFPGDGCGENCSETLTCGHMCPMKCHPTHVSHGKCKVKLPKTFEPCLHQVLIVNTLHFNLYFWK